ncbi:hypothetical protein V5O48_008247 [Marasmius crinis-equi]|uniref:Uncharacterized protein n=1 Tax=Marasmius crinis-equi TaxID=585013 RepID=A0ABR3FEK4_9AGAR
MALKLFFLLASTLASVALVSAGGQNGTHGPCVPDFHSQPITILNYQGDYIEIAGVDGFMPERVGKEPEIAFIIKDASDPHKAVTVQGDNSSTLAWEPVSYNNVTQLFNITCTSCTPHNAFGSAVAADKCTVKAGTGKNAKNMCLDAKSSEAGLKVCNSSSAEQLFSVVSL